MKNKGKRISGLILIIALGISIYWIYNRFANPAVAETSSGIQPDATLESAVPVELTPVSKCLFEKRLVVQGNLESATYANVASRVEGTLEAIFVDEGDSVLAGKTKLFQIDSMNLKRGVELRRQDLAVAECSLREKEANRERIEAELQKAEKDYRRNQTLYEGNSISADALEQYEMRYKQAKASLKYAQSLVDLGNEQKRQAEVALDIVKKDLSDALVYAPIDGKVSRKYQEVGEMGKVGDPVLRIDDTTTLEASAFLPAQYYAEIQPLKTKVHLQVYGIDAGESVIAYKSPTIHPQFRTFEIKCFLESLLDSVAPGAMAEVRVLLDQRTGLGVPTGAIQKRQGKAVVFSVKGGMATLEPVQPGMETDGWIELVDCPLAPGTPVVSVGQDFLNPGTRISVVKESR